MSANGRTIVPQTPDHTRKPGSSRPVTTAEMLTRIARFNEHSADDAAFPDLKSAGHKREVRYMISTDALAGPAPITAPHNFHLALLTMPPGMKPVVHAHPYNEIFMPIDAPFRFYWGDSAGDDEENSQIVGPLDVISVPAGVHRTFTNLSMEEARVMAIFDIAGDPHVDMVVPPAVYEEFYKDGWTPGQPPKD